MSGTDITVHVNRGSANTLESEADSLETDGPVRLVLRGHERPAHVHCRLVGDVDRVATVPRSNYYIGPDDITPVPISVDGEAIDEPLEGRLEVVTGYGSESVTIDLTLLPPPPEVEIDETLTQPNRARSDPDAVDRALEVARGVGLDSTTLGVLGLAVFALAVAVLTAATVGSFVALLGLVIVGAGAAVALWLLLS